MRARVAFATLASAGLILGAVAAPALAHSELVSSTPAKGSTVKHLPRTVVLTFSEPLAKVTSVKLLHYGVHDHATSARLNPRNARQVLVRTAMDEAGVYTVRALVVADDGHREIITYKFTVKR